VFFAIDFSGQIGHYAQMRVFMCSGLFLLAACAQTPEPTAAEAALQSQCDAGNTSACAAIVQTEQSKRDAQLAGGMALLGYSAALQQPTYYPTTTSCMGTGMMVSCTGY
jgi:hypothetical protein